MNPGAGPRNNLKENYNIFLNDLGPFRFRAVINIEQHQLYHRLATLGSERSPRADKALATRAGEAQACITLKYRIKAKLATFKQTWR